MGTTGRERDRERKKERENKDSCSRGLAARTRKANNEQFTGETCGVVSIHMEMCNCIKETTHIKTFWG